MNLEDRWIPPNRCDCCETIAEEWDEEHVAVGGSGFNFIWCWYCDHNRRDECDKIITDHMRSWLERNRINS